MDDALLHRSWGAAALAAVAVTDVEGGILLEPVVPLVNGGLGLVLSYDRTEFAQLLAAVGRATLTTWDSRLALRGWQPVAADVRLDVTADPDGRWVAEGWLDPLLQASPPERARLDTPLLRREHWWYVPRWLVTVTSVERSWPLARRMGPLTGLLAWDGGAGAVDAEVVEAEGWGDDPLRLRPLHRDDLDPPHAAPAALLAQDVRTPDLDHIARLHVSGHLEGAHLHVGARRGQAELGAPPSLWRRLQEARALERACRRALAGVHGDR